MGIKKATGRTEPWTRTIYGSPQSKANSRRIATHGGVSRIVKSAAALSYAKDFLRQCPALSVLFEGDVTVEMTIYYATRRNDLDDSLILDLLQDRVYRNDRQCKRRVIEWGLDPANPRAEIRISPYTPHDAGIPSG